MAKFATSAAWSLGGFAVGALFMLLLLRLEITPTYLAGYSSAIQAFTALGAIIAAALLLAATQRQVAAAHQQVALTISGQQQANEQLAREIRRQARLEEAHTIQAFIFDAVEAVASVYYVARTFFLDSKRFLDTRPLNIGTGVRLEDELHQRVAAPLLQSLNSLEAKLDRVEAMLVVFETRARADNDERRENAVVKLRDEMRSFTQSRKALFAFLSDASNVRRLEPVDFDRDAQVIALREHANTFTTSALDMTLTELSTAIEEEEAAPWVRDKI